MKQSRFFLSVAILGVMGVATGSAFGQSKGMQTTRVNTLPQAYRVWTPPPQTVRPAMPLPPQAKPKTSTPTAPRVTQTPKAMPRPNGILSNYPSIFFEAPTPFINPAIELGPSYRPIIRDKR